MGNLSFTWDGDDLNVVSSTSGRPKVTIQNTTPDNKPSALSFYKNRGVGNGTASDYIGTISFDGKDASGNAHEYALIQAQIVDPTHTDEAGMMQFKVTSSTGTSSSGRVFLKGTGSNSDNDVNVDIGYGTTSITTVAGDLSVDGKAGKGIPWLQTMSGYKTNNGSDTTYYFPYRGTTGENWSNSDSSPTSVNQYDSTAGFMIAPRNGSITSVKVHGYVSGVLDDFKFHFFKGAITNNSTSISLSSMFSTSAISPTTNLRTWSHTEDFSSSNTFDEDDMLVCMIKKEADTGNASHYFTITISGYWTEN